MRFYPTTDINFFYDIPPSWSIYCRTPRKSWKRFPALQNFHTMHIYCDLEGAVMRKVLRKHLYFNGEWPKSRIRNEACLPTYYGVGSRFIRLERAPPVGFKCSPMPISVKEMRAINAYFKKISKDEARMQKLQEKGSEDKDQGKKNKK